MLQALIYLILPACVLWAHPAGALAVAVICTAVLAWPRKLPDPQVPFPARVMAMLVALVASYDIGFALTALLFLAVMRSEIEFGAAEMEDAL